MAPKKRKSGAGGAVDTLSGKKAKPVADHDPAQWQYIHQVTAWPLAKLP